MGSLIKLGVSGLTSGLLVFGLSGCQKTESAAEGPSVQKGPAEKVGEQLDQAAAEAARQLNTMAEHAGKGLEKAGEALQNEAKNAKDKAAASKEEAQAKETHAKEIPK